MKNEISLKRKDINNYLFPIYYWGFTFLNPIVSKAGEYSTLILLIFALMMFSLWFLVILRKKAVNISVFIGFGFLLILALDMLIRSNSKSFDYIYKYIYAGFLVILFVSIINDSTKTLKVFSVLSVCAFLLFFYDPFLDYKFLGDYMGYGFNLVLPAFIGIFILCHYYKKWWLLPLEIFCLALILIYANRSAFLTAIIFILLYYLTMHKKRKIILGFLVFTTLTLFLLLEHIILFVMEIFVKLDLNTYAIQQFIKFIQFRDTESFFSGRFDIWQNAWNMFLSKPILGHGAGYFHAVHGTYPHNIVLDILVTYGIIGIIAIGLLIFMSFYKLAKNNGQNKLLGLLFLSLWFPKLVFSVYFIVDEGFWAFIAYGFLFFNGIALNKEVKDGKS